MKHVKIGNNQEKLDEYEKQEENNLPMIKIYKAYDQVSKTPMRSNIFLSHTHSCVADSTRFPMTYSMISFVILC